MTGGTKLAIIAAGLIGLWFVWIAIDVQFDDERDSAIENRRAAREVSGQRSAREPRAALDRDKGESRLDTTRLADRRPIERRPGDRADAKPGGRRIDGRGGEGRRPLPQRRDDVPGSAAGRVDLPASARARAESDDPIRSRRQRRPDDPGQPAVADSSNDADGANRGATRDSTEKVEGYIPSPGDLKPFADLHGANLNRRQMAEIDLLGADLTGAKLHQANLVDAELGETRFTGADLTKADLRRSNLSDSDLHGARLDSADLRGAELLNVDLSRSSLNKTNFGGVTFRDADLTGADLSGAILFGVDLRDTILADVNLAEADLREANLTDVDLTGVQNLTCVQLTLARGWQASIRSDDLACGASIPGADADL